MNPIPTPSAAIRQTLARCRAAARPALITSLAWLRQRWRRLTWRQALVALAAVPLLLLCYALLLIPFTPSISDIRKAAVEQPAQVLFADGKKLAEFKLSHREWVALADISPHVVDALIATEDHRFYAHHGIDFRRTLAAAVYTLRGDRQGGSTLTQQLARNLYPEEIGRAPTLTRKLKEAITALKIEAVHSKDGILETYLNTVPFLYNAFGIEMAARTYFDTRAGKLDVLQSATLVGMLKGNSYYNPMLNPERSLERRNTVLAQMVKHGKLSAAAFEKLRKAPLNLDFERQSERTGPAPHFAQQLRKWLIAWADRNDYNIYADGLIVYTTLDSRLQELANRVVEARTNQLQGVADGAWSTRSGWNLRNPLVETLVAETPEYRKARADGLPHAQALKQLTANPAFLLTLRQQKTMIQAGFLAVDPRDGHIKAWVGSRDFDTDAFDHVQLARRQPGSTFKPFVYAEAFRQGISPDATFTDQAVEIRIGDEIWAPTDGKPPSGKEMSLRDALAQSKNTITAQLVQRVGTARVAHLAQALGIRQSKLDPVPALALGTSPVSLREMVSAYATLANGGEYIAPLMVTRITDRQGKVLEEFADPEPERALDARTSYTAVDVLRGVIDRGTGVAIRNRFGIRADVAGKTGTTQDNADGWFILMQPQLVAGAWVGFNDPRITLRSDYWGQGAHSALPIVGDVFRGATRLRLIDVRQRFEPPEDNSPFRRGLKYASEGFARLTTNIDDWFSGLLARFRTEETPPQRKSTPPRPRPADTGTPAPASPGAPTPEAPSDPLDEMVERIMREDAGAPENPDAGQR